jgi:hypothetical protein
MGVVLASRGALVLTGSSSGTRIDTKACSSPHPFNTVSFLALQSVLFTGYKGEGGLERIRKETGLVLIKLLPSYLRGATEENNTFQKIIW